MPPTRDPVRPGQESVWDYPRPPRLEAIQSHLVVVFDGLTVAETRAGFRVLETSHPPVYYFPAGDVNAAVLRPEEGESFCEYKGLAGYASVVGPTRVAERSAWVYRRPSSAFAALAGCYAFYAAAMDACTVDGELATPQPGGFYGGWVTSKVAGPFKGVPGSRFW